MLLILSKKNVNSVKVSVIKSSLQVSESDLMAQYILQEGIVGFTTLSRSASGVSDRAVSLTSVRCQLLNVNYFSPHHALSAPIASLPRVLLVCI